MLVACLVILGTQASAVMAQTTITKVAGQEIPGFDGDGFQAGLALLNSPQGLATDAFGNVYIADTNNNRIRRIGLDGVITTIAGNGTQGFSGNDGPARNASFNRPRGVAVDSQGNIYVNDRGNNRIRRITPDGTIRQFAGSGEAGAEGDGGPAANAQLGFPWGIAIDQSDRLLIADTANHRIRMVRSDGVIVKVAGNGFQGSCCEGGQAEFANLDTPFRIAVSPTGAIYFSELDKIRVIEGGLIRTFAGTGVAGYSGDFGPAAQAQLNSNDSMAFDSEGNMYFSDAFNNVVRKIEAQPPNTITTVAGTGVPGYSGDGGDPADAQLRQPGFLAIDPADRIYIAQYVDNRIRMISTGSPTEQTILLISFVEQTQASQEVKSNLASNLTTIAGLFEAGRPRIACAGLVVQAAAIRVRTRLAPRAGVTAADGKAIIGKLNAMRDDAC